MKEKTAMNDLHQMALWLAEKIVANLNGTSPAAEVPDGPDPDLGVDAEMLVDVIKAMRTLRWAQGTQKDNKP